VVATIVPSGRNSTRTFTPAFIAALKSRFASDCLNLFPLRGCQDGTLSSSPRRTYQLPGRTGWRSGAASGKGTLLFVSGQTAEAADGNVPDQHLISSRRDWHTRTSAQVGDHSQPKGNARDAKASSARSRPGRRRLAKAACRRFDDLIDRQQIKMQSEDRNDIVQCASGLAENVLQLFEY
jgi:hypothetical protein